MDARYCSAVALRDASRLRSHLHVRDTIVSPRRLASHAPENRIKKRDEFLHIQKEGKKLHAKSFLVAILPSLGTQSRLGVVVSTKVEARSVRRNRIKRILREIFRRVRSGLRNQFDIVIIARNGSSDCTFGEIEEQILGALGRHGFLSSTEA